MSELTPRFALNHMVCPRLPIGELIEAAVSLGLGAIELRNDVQDNSLRDPAQAREAGQRAQEAGVEILSVNALYPFNDWNGERAAQAEELAGLAAACGARGLVLCPLVGGDDARPEADSVTGLKQALRALDDILGRHGLQGFVEPLGFPTSTLRTKRAALTAIRELGLAPRFRLVHDTFHHQGAGDTDVFADMTGLVHISDVADPAIGFEEMLDGHRSLVGEADRLDNVGQLRRLLDEGYDGHVSFEPFAEAVHAAKDPLAELRQSLAFVRACLAR